MLHPVGPGIGLIQSTEFLLGFVRCSIEDFFGLNQKKHPTSPIALCREISIHQVETESGFQVTPLDVNFSNMST